MPAIKKRMSNRKPDSRTGGQGIEKCPTGIRGLDEITGGGLPRGRPTLVCGAAGSGKTLMAMEFIVRGIRDFGESGVFMTFEETESELAKNVASLGFDLPGLIRRKQLAVDFVHVERSEIQETGEYDLEGLFVRLGNMMADTGAKRVVLDSLEALFAGLPNEGILRAELRRLFRWLKDQGVTAVITGLRDAGLGEGAQLTEIWTTRWDDPTVLQLLNAFRAFFALLWALLRRRLDIVHLHVSTGGSIVRKAIFARMARLFGVPVVAHLHSGDLERWSIVQF